MPRHQVTSFSSAVREWPSSAFPTLTSAMRRRASGLPSDASAGRCHAPPCSPGCGDQTMISPAKCGRKLTPISMLVVSAKLQNSASRQRRQVVGCRRHQSPYRRCRPGRPFSERSRSPLATAVSQRDALRAVAMHLLIRFPPANRRRAIQEIRPPAAEHGIRDS